MNISLSLLQPICDFKRYALFAAVGSLFVSLGGCTQQTSPVTTQAIAPVKSQAPVAAQEPVSLALKPKFKNAQNAASKAETEMTSFRGAVNEAHVKKAIYRYEVTTGIKGGTKTIAGVDLNKDGIPEALVAFTGDEWCSFAGCRLVVFKKTANGFRPMQTIKNADAPVWITPDQNSGWHHMIVKTGSSGKRRDVTLRFSGNYPGDAARIKTPNSDIPVGEVVIDRDYSGQAQN